MIISKFTNATIARTVRCSTRSVQTIRSNLRYFGTTKVPLNGVGRRRTIIPPILSVLLEQLIEKPELYQDEIAIFLYDEFEVDVTTPTISRALVSAGWSRKAARRVAKERNADLRDFYLHNLSEFRSYHLVYIDESRYDNRIRFRRTGQSPLGVIPVQIARLYRDQRHQILPAYVQDSILLARVFQGSIDTTVFEDFIEQLLHYYSKQPKPKSVLIIDNASFYYSTRIEELCREARVKLLYLLPYSSDLNPIEEFFAELKMFIKRNQQRYTDDPGQDFKVFLEQYIETVGARKSSAEGHFRHSELSIEEP